MSNFSHPEVLTEVAGVKIVTFTKDPFSLGKMVLKMRKINRESYMHGKSCGFHLTKSKWDPYPWISYVENNSLAGLAGLKAGDCLLAVDENDLLGLKIKDIANLICNEENSRQDVNLTIWRYMHEEEQTDTGVALKGPLTTVARNLANALSGMIRALECPICLESAAPPVSQCVYGHILCVVCRAKSTRCPICRVRLGQGRCLLADKLHKALRDAFNMNNDGTADVRYNLHHQLLGKDSKQQETPTANRSKNNFTLKPRQFLLARLLLENRERAASMNNLTEVSETATAAFDQMTNANNLNVRLSLNDRTKSASTGELSKNNETRVNDSSQHVELFEMNINQRSLNLPQTLSWGGSTDSVSCIQVICPLARSCREVVTSDSLLDHIRTHAVPQIHFYFGKARIPLPLPFGSEALYILHHGNNIFFFQYEEETAWMAHPAKRIFSSNTWEWTLHACNDNTDIQLQRHVASLEDGPALSSQYTALLPNALLLKIIEIQILEDKESDRLYM